MGIGKRILDVARSNLNALLEKAAEQADPRRKLADLSDEELEAELRRRREARAAERRVEEGKAKVTGTGTGTVTGTAADRAERERIAREREAKVKAAREAREREARAREQARAKEAPPRGRAGARPAGKKQDPQIAQYYARLELEYGASWDEVKAQYRKLMRKYHPDLHVGNPSKFKAATEVSQALTQAYNELERWLLGGPNRA